MLNSDSFQLNDSDSETKLQKQVINVDELGFDDEQIDAERRKVQIDEQPTVVQGDLEKIKLDPTDFSMQLLEQLRHEYITKYSKIKYLLLFDKSLPTTDVSYLMVNPLDNRTLLSRAFKFHLSPLRDLIFYRAVNIDNKVYIMGGISTKSRKVSTQTFCFDCKSNSWKECDPMITPRCKFSVSVAKNQIYIVGGQDIYGTPLFSVERYDPRTNRWTDLGVVTIPVKSHASCVMKNRYVIVSGGYGVKEENFNIYDTEIPDWRRPVATYDLPIDRENHAMVQHKGNTYLVGGIRYEARANDPDNPEPINENSINSLNINSFTALNNRSWKTLSHPNTYQDRNGCTACVIGNYVYIIGGHTVVNNDNEVTVESKLVERFDPLTNRIEKAFMLEKDIGCMDVDCCLVEIDVTENPNFSIDALFFNHTPLW